MGYRQTSLKLAADAEQTFLSYVQTLSSLINFYRSVLRYFLFSLGSVLILYSIVLVDRFVVIFSSRNIFLNRLVAAGQFVN
jgi:hypothetical protein